tara:strand:+ start:1 stop:1746 length:1746 start_codon:yes stop_codon:yes gene_type:complete
MKTFINVAQMKLAVLKEGQFVETGGYYTKGDAGAARYLIKAAQPLAEGDETLSDGQIAVISGKNFKSTSVGSGVKNNSQTNVGSEIRRDWSAATASVHGFNVSDYFAVDGMAMNVLGSDVLIGDGTQDALFDIDHVNSFQCTDLVNLGLGAISAHLGFVDQTVLQSGTIKRTSGFTAVDVLGGRDTPGFSTPNFELAGPAVVNNQTGVGTLIRHGNNARSIHCAAGNTDAGALLTSGGAPVDLECPVYIRQATPAISTLSGAIICTAGGIASTGAHFAGGEVSVVAGQPIYRLRNAANAEIGRVFHDGSIMRVVNQLNNALHLGINGASSLEVKSDRFIPSIDATLNNGDATHRWIQSYVTIAESVTSDGRTKTKTDDLNDLLLDAWGEVLAVSFKRNQSIEKKGESARVHMGYIAQDIQQAFESKGLDPFKFSLLSSSELTEQIEKTRKVQVQKTQPVDVEKIDFERDNNGGLIRKVSTVSEEKPIYERLNVLNEDGSPYLVEQFIDVKTGTVDENGKEEFKTISEMVPLIQDNPVMIEVDESYKETVFTGEFRMGLRYTECLVLESAYLRREIARLKTQ